MNRIVSASRIVESRWAMTNDPCDHHAGGHEKQEDTGQRYTVIKHDDQRSDNGTDRYDQFQQTCLKHIRDLIQVTGNTAEDLAGFVLVKETKRKPVQFLFCQYFFSFYKK